MSRVDKINLIQAIASGLQVILQAGAQVENNFKGLEIPVMWRVILALVGVTISGTCMTLSQFAHSAALATPTQPLPEHHEAKE